MKKAGSVTVSLLLAASLMLSACANNKANQETNNSKETGNKPQEESFNKEGLPIVKDKVNLTIVSPKAQLAPEYNEMEIFKRLETDTNVHIEWNNIPDTDYLEKKNLLLASGDLPDAFYNSQFTDYELITYGEDGTIIPLEDLIDQYAPNLKKLLE